MVNRVLVTIRRCLNNSSNLKNLGSLIPIKKSYSPPIIENSIMSANKIEGIKELGGARKTFIQT